MANVAHEARGKSVSFPSKTGVLLHGFLLDAAVAVQDAAILCHGLASNCKDFHFEEIAAALAGLGVSSLRFDFPGNGQSKGAFKYADTSAQVDDIAQAADFLRARGMKPRALLGHSKGGSGVIVYAAKYGDIDCIVNVSGRFDCKRGVEERFGTDIHDRIQEQKSIPVTWRQPDGSPLHWEFTLEDYTERMTLDMAEQCARVPPEIRVCTIHGTADEMIPFQDAQSFTDCLVARLTARPGLTLVEGADHNYTRPEWSEKMLDAAVDFICDCLEKQYDAEDY